MRDIDLIPRAYHELVQIRRLAGIAGLALAALVTVTAVTFTGLHWQLRKEQQITARLRVDADRVSALRKHTEGTGARKEKLEHMYLAMAALRGSGEVLQAAYAIDRALNADVWLTSIRFTRNVQSLDKAKPDDAATPGEVLLQKSPIEKQPGWRILKKIEIGGAALDHSSLSEFMRSFQTQPGIADVRFLNSHVGAGTSKEVVEFNAAATVRLKDRSS